MTSSTRSWLKKLIPGVLLGFLVLLVLMLVGDLRQVGELIQHFDWRYFAAALGFTLFNYTLRFFKWHFYLHLSGVTNLSIPASARLFVAGFPLAVTPGKVGEALKGVWLNQRTGLPVARGISVVVAERLSDGLAVMLLSTLGVIAFPRYWLAFAIVLVGLLSVIVISQVRPAALWLLDLSARISLLKRISAGLREFYEGSFALFRPLALLLGVGLGMLSWLGEGIGFYLILLGLGLPPSFSLASAAVFVLAFSTIIGAVSALPGGLGAAEASIAGMLVLTAGLTAPQASAAALLIRLATLWFGVTLGLLVWAFSPDLFAIQERTTDVES